MAILSYMQDARVADAGIRRYGLRHAYAADIDHFLRCDDESVLGELTAASHFDITQAQRDAWILQLLILKQALAELAAPGRIYLEFVIPRLGKRVDAVAVIDHVVFVIEFKVGEQAFHRADIDQVWDYALDLRNFHDTSHSVPIAPVLIATAATSPVPQIAFHANDSRMTLPFLVGATQLCAALSQGLSELQGPSIDPRHWEAGRYSPTPTIIEAARALYANHAVEEISRSDAGAVNLQLTSHTVDRIIDDARARGRKAICFITGVPGAGKTLVGLDVATRHRDETSEAHSIFLSGNGPLVAVLREALARDYIERRQTQGIKIAKGEARRIVSTFIQNVHHYRDAYLADGEAPIDHVALFDEAQRAWDEKQTTDFMRRKRDLPNFTGSEPKFLISCLNRHKDWAVVVCLVGGGQEINKGEGGVSEWFDAIAQYFPDWDVHVSPELTTVHYDGQAKLAALRSTHVVANHRELHLSTSMRSFRAANLSEFVRLVLDRERDAARAELYALDNLYPIRLTRSLDNAKTWVRAQARGSERYGIVVSSQAQRLKPLAVDVRAKTDPVHWFLHGKHDTRSSYYLEDVATEFQVQGLELDWTCVVWDADLRYTTEGWRHHEFQGTRWTRINQPNNQRYLVNAYRVLLTRARQGMVLVVPEGSATDPTRAPHLYDPTFEFLRSCGISAL